MWSLKNLIHSKSANPLVACTRMSHSWSPALRPRGSANRIALFLTDTCGSESQLDKNNGLMGETSNEVAVMGIKAIWSGKITVAPDNTKAWRQSECVYLKIITFIKLFYIIIFQSTRSCTFIRLKTRYKTLNIHTLRYDTGF